MRDGHELVVGLLTAGIGADVFTCPDQATTAWRLPPSSTARSCTPPRKKQWEVELAIKVVESTHSS